MNKQELHDKIKNAFRDVTYPGDENLAAKGSRDGGKETLEWFAGKDRYSFKPRELRAERFYGLSPEARHYYLPAYLLAAIEENCRDLIPEMTYILTPKESVEKEKAGGFLILPFGRLSKTQKEAIYEFLNLIAETGGSSGDVVAELVYLETPKEYAETSRDGGFQLLPWEHLRNIHKEKIHDFLNLIAAGGGNSENLTAGLVYIPTPKRSAHEDKNSGFHILPFGRLTDTQKAVIYDFLNWILNDELQKLASGYEYMLEDVLETRRLRDHWRKLIGISSSSEIP